MLGLELTPEYPIDNLVELGTQTEREGYDSCFVPYHYSNRDPFMVLTRLAAETDGIRPSPGVASLYELHPVTFAGKVATTAEALDGRDLLDIGPGNPSTLRSLSLEDERGLHSVLKAFKVAQKLWDGERVSHDDVFEVADAGLNFDVPGEVPVYVGGEGPYMCRMVGKHADGLLLNGSHPDDLVWVCKQIDIGVEDRPDSRGEFTLAACASVSVSEDTDAARETARPPVAFIVAGAAPPVLDRHGIDADHASDIGEEISAGNFSEAFNLVIPAMIDAFPMVGTPDDVADRMDAVFEHADGVVVESPVGPDLEEMITFAAAAYRSTNRRR